MDIGLAETLLNDILRLRRRLPILHARAELRWTHYRQLLKLPSQDQIRFYEKQASEGNWSVRQLQSAIRENAYEQEVGRLFAVPLYDDPVGDRPLRARFGQLNTYRVVASGDPADESLFLDLGFNVTTRLFAEEATGLQTDQLVQITESAERRSIAPCPSNTRRYTYRAWVQRVGRLRRRSSS